MYKLVPWLPKGLMHWDYPRKVFGLLLPEGVKVTADNYILYHDQKVTDLLAKEDEPQHWLENMLPRGWERKQVKSPQELFQWLDGEGDPVWRGDRTFLDLYLKKQMSLKELLHLLPLDLEEKEPLPSPRQFQRELRDLTLPGYLELTVSSKTS